MITMKKNLILLYNLYMVILIPFTVALIGLWSLESKGIYTYSNGGGMPLGVLIIFLPEMIFGLGWKLDSKPSIILCSIVIGFLLYKLFHHFFRVVTDAPVTYYCVMAVIVINFVWIILIEFSEDLKEHLLTFPSAQSLFPCSEDPDANRTWRTIWLMLLIVAAALTLTITWVI